jgi:alkanesulfonate monooxygenase SsuD/methylene tetrahydromethanopterin reductase-like flavin-dependent oxidoreductase (luciferase family)
MDVGIGLPSTIRGTTREQLLEWARRAEARGFSSLGTIDRIAYGNYEPLVALAAAGAVTERIKLVTSVLLAPTRHDGTFLAKQAASVDALAPGRLILGVAVGGREDDFTAVGADFRTRGRDFDVMLAAFERTWAGDTIGPAGRPKLIIGGGVPAAFERTAKYADGWIMGGGTPDMLRDGAEKTRAAWKAAGREGEPRIMSLAYYALGENAEAAARRYLGDYYAFLGDYVDQIVQSAATDAQTVQAYVKAFADAGCDELILFPSDPDPGQVDLLADAIGEARP